MQSNFGPGGQCVGLAEQDANTGFLVEFCENGNWFIYTISNGGAINQTLDQSVTSTRSNVHISLTLQGSTLTFAIDGETHQVNISPIQPTKVAIAILSNAPGYSITVSNFSYMALAS